VSDGLPLGAILICAGAFAAFVFPGYGWVTWLHREERFPWPVRLVLGFAWSFALFSLAGVPFLWFRGSFAGFLAVFSPLWALFTLAGVFALRRARAAGGPAPPEAPPPDLVPGQPPPDGAAGGVPGAVWPLLGAYLGLVGLAVYAWAFGGGGRRLSLTMYLPALLLLAGWLAWQLRRLLGPALRFGAEDESPPPRLWAAAAAALIGWQAVSAEVYYRPDWDDCFYLGAVLEYQGAEALNGRDPAEREGGSGVGPAHRTMCWELWGAVLCSLSGLNPLALFHSFLPGLLVLGAYAAYAALLAECLPRRWVPLGLVGLSAYYVWGISTNANACDHFLVRVWQGKSVLLHLALPLLAALLIRFSRGPTWRRWLSLGACVVCGLGLSSSAVFLGFILLGGLALALLPAVQGGRLHFLAGVALAMTPLAANGLGILAEIKPSGGAGEASAGPGAGWDAGANWYLWFLQFQDLAGRGSAEVVWLVSLPLLAALLGGRRGAAYLLAFPALLFLTFANPFLAGAVSARVTSPPAYYRIFWLFPIGPGLGALFALLSRLAGALAGRLLGARLAHLPLAAAAAGLALCPLLPGLFVWDAGNNLGPFMTPRRAENLEKMPAELRLIAGRLARDPDAGRGRILCGEEVTSFLTPLSPDFRFVVTRPMYTLYSLAHAGQIGEVQERLALLVLASEGAAVERKELRRLLERYQVLFVVTSPVVWAPDDQAREGATRRREDLLRGSGYQALYLGDDYGLWKKAPPPGG
jgi:hypothetical protein